MGFPINADLTRRIAKDAFYSEIEAEANKRIYPMIAEEIPQETASVIRVGMGAPPRPVQLSGTAAGMQGARAKQMKDYTQTTTVVEWDVTVEMPRSVAEDLPEEVARISRDIAAGASVFFDERAIGQLDSSTALGYDGDALYSTTHDESGTSQDNARTSAAATGTVPTAAELEAALITDLSALRDFTDDQGRPVNEGAGGFDMIIPPEFEWIYKQVLDPNLRNAYDSSSATGRFRGMFNVKVSAYVPGDRHFIFAQGRRKALGYYTKTAWDFNTNIGTDSDAWNHGRTWISTGYARFEFQPRDWKKTIRHVFT